jgi:ABC-2 type transport system permease protein
MKKDILYFIAQTKFNLKNAHALRKSFWIGVFSMMLNNVAFFVIWLFFMKATGPINGWTAIDVFGMLGISMICFGVTQGFFYGIRELPELVLRGNFDSVLLAPVNSFFKLAGSAFSVTAYGDLLIGVIVAILYGIYVHFSFLSWLLFIFSIILGCIVFICFRLICSLVVFFVHDGEIVSTQMFEIFLRPSLYPGAIFPDKLKIFCMTIVPTLITSAVPIDIVKLNSFLLFLFTLGITCVWVSITYFVFKISIKHYESGNFLR